MAQRDDLGSAVPASEADRMRASLRALRANVIEAWQSRAVLLTRDEQNELRDEIRKTCALLTDLTASESGNARL